MILKINLIIACCIILLGCDSANEDFISLGSGELFSFDLGVYGDEEGATIIQQAQHFSRSEIVRDSSTNWGAFYYYEPGDGYHGLDFVRIETCTGGKGTHCDEINTVELNFKIKE